MKVKIQEKICVIRSLPISIFRKKTIIIVQLCPLRDTFVFVCTALARDEELCEQNAITRSRPTSHFYVHLLGACVQKNICLSAAVVK